MLALLDGVLVLKDCRSCKACCFDRHPEISNKKKKIKSAVDIVRLIVSELLVYPVLICSIFSVVTGRGYEGETHLDRFGFTLFIVSCLSLLLYNYLIRMIALVGVLWGVTKVRIPSEKLLNRYNAQCQDYYDSSIHVSAFSYLLYFVVHAFFQMVTQVLMIVAIGAKIDYEYNDFQKDQNVTTYTESILYSSDLDESETTCCSGHLWYMIIWGYVSPTLGFLTFFIVTYYWSQEFPIGLCIDLIAIGRMKGKDYLLKLRGHLKSEEAKAQRVFEQFYKMQSDFKTLCDEPFSSKLTYAFKSPGLIFLCICYGVLQATFVICAAVTYDADMGTLVVHILNGGGWVLYYIVACVIGAIANLYVLLVAAMWIIIICLIILAILSAILCSDDQTKKNQVKKVVREMVDAA